MPWRGSVADYMKQKYGSVSWKIKQWNSPRHSSKKKKELYLMKITQTTSREITFSLQGPQKEKKGKRGQKTYFEQIMAENFHNLGKETDVQVQEAQRVLNKMNPKRATPRHIIIKMSKK